MAFGLAPAPRVFTKNLKVVMVYLREQGIRLVIYLDDILVLNESSLGLQEDIGTINEQLQSLGFLVNWEKSIVDPTQVLEYLGLVVSSKDLSFSLPVRKVEAVKKMCEAALKEGKVTLRTLASIQGNFSWAITAIPFAQSHYRSLQRFYITNAERYCFYLDVRVSLSDSAKMDLRWWVANVEKSKGKIFFPRDPDIEIFSDASLTGALYAVQAFSADSSGIAIRIYLDNTTAVSYVNKCGGTKSAALTATAKSLSKWCEKRCISLEAIHLAGEFNTIADRESRAQADASDWQLDVNVFHRIAKLWEIDIDLFASSWNAQSALLNSPVKLKLHHPNAIPLEFCQVIQLYDLSLVVLSTVTSFAKARQALHTTTPNTIFCRDKELTVIENFMRPLIDERKPGSMYKSGRPGTGKTACVTQILSNTTFSGKFKSIFVNCMLLQTPASVLQQIAQPLDPKWNASAKEALPFVEDRLTDTGPMIIFVLDEIDQMSM
ncbi:Uncharacterized protein APZ42_031574 [Daphnia magna]|uniref:Reverse transcriptase domain-containing protein n=1 Tax=Daphnia magna TaxID=35525 RepID=A0A164MR93_9CRUS|nr:Uncharacterized protein APZ42_031574 [Daphnia magna]